MGKLKSPEYIAGFTAALVFVSDIFESHQQAFMRRRVFRERDIRMILRIIDACIRRRETLADVGPKNMNLFIRPDKTVELKEK